MMIRMDGWWLIVSDAISRNAALNALLMSADYKDACDMLEQLPTVFPVAVIHARWIRQKGSAHVFKCSVCEFVFAGAEIAHYCPNCGARMDGGDIDESK